MIPPGLFQAWLKPSAVWLVRVARLPLLMSRSFAPRSRVPVQASVVPARIRLPVTITNVRLACPEVGLANCTSAPAPILMLENVALLIPI